MNEGLAHQKGATRERILEAALEVFARKGYHRAIVDDIVRASASGTSKGGVEQIVVQWLRADTPDLPATILPLTRLFLCSFGVR